MLSPEATLRFKVSVKSPTCDKNLYVFSRFVFSSGSTESELFAARVSLDSSDAIPLSIGGVLEYTPFLRLVPISRSLPSSSVRARCCDKVICLLYFDARTLPHIDAVTSTAASAATKDTTRT